MSRKLAWSFIVCVSVIVHLALGLWLVRVVDTETTVSQGAGSVVLSLVNDDISVASGSSGALERQPTPTPTPEPEPEPEQILDAGVQSLESVDVDGKEKRVAGVVSEPSATNGGDPQAEQNYQQELQLWLQRYKSYPRRLQRRGIQGVVLVKFTLDASGRLLTQELARGSGEQALDEAAMKLLRDAQPMPVIPESLDVESYTVTVPIRYSIE